MFIKNLKLKLKTLILIRILMGLGEGVTFPSWHAIYARWIPFKERLEL